MIRCLSLAGVLMARRMVCLSPSMSCGLHGEGLVQLVRRAGELRQHERAAEVVAARDVLLGDEVHPVAQRRDEHDVGREVERRHLLARVGVVEVVRRPVADRAELAVDAADGLLDLVAQVAVGVDALAARGRDLHERHVGRPDAPLARAAPRRP